MIINNDALTALKELPDESVQMCVTSPPYYMLRNYGVDGQIGMEDSPEAYITRLVDVFREVKRVLKDDGVLWINIGDSYNGSGKAVGANLTGTLQESNMSSQATGATMVKGLKPKDMIGIPWMLAFALRGDGWYLRQDIIWHKPSVMVESVTDRCTKAHEYIFLLAKNKRYYFNHRAIQEPSVEASKGRKNLIRKSGKYADPTIYAVPGVNTLAKKDRARWQTDELGNPVRNKRSVWTVSLRPFKGAHFATYPPELIRPCILAGSCEGDVVLDPFFGSGTTGVVALELKRNFIGIELNPEYCKLAEERIYGNL